MNFVTKSLLTCALLMNVHAYGISQTSSAVNHRNYFASNTTASKDNETLKTTKDSKIPEKICNPWPAVYDPTNSRFVVREGGLSESFLDSLIRTTSIGFRSKMYMDYFRMVDSLEHVGSWIPPGNIEGGLSRANTYLTAAYNFLDIYNVDRISREDLNERYLPLKDLLSSLDFIYEDDESSVLKLAEMYNVIRVHITSGKPNRCSVGLVEMLNGVEGDCNDLSPAYYSLFSYYGFESCMRFGKRLDSKGKDAGLHAWVNVGTECGYIDLDPTWYGIFVPLEDRCAEIKCNPLKDDYIRTKKDFGKYKLKKEYFK